MAMVILAVAILGNDGRLFAATSAAPSRHDARPGVKTGDGYLELPVTDYITEVYSKGDDMAFVVNGVSTARGLGDYIIDWHGDRLWSTQGKTGASLDHKGYLNSHGWRRLDKVRFSEEEVILSLAGESKIQYAVREDHLDADPTFDYCLSLSSAFLKIIYKDNIRYGSFIRLLDKASRQYPLLYCLSNGRDYFGDNSNSTIFTKIAQHNMLPDIIELSPEKILFVDNSVAILLKPNFNFYAGHPDDYYFITRDEAVDIEKRVMLAVAGRLNDQPPDRGNSVIFDKDAKLSFLQAEALLSNELDRLFKQNGKQ